MIGCEKYWDCFSKAFKTPDGTLLVVTGEMGIAQCHRDICMPQQFFHGQAIQPNHYQAARKHVPQVMECEILKPGLAHSLLKC